MLGGKIHTVSFIKIAEMAYNRCEFIFFHRPKLEYFGQ
jgi:hypothetical protein